MLESELVCPEDTSLQPVLTKESSLGGWPLMTGRKLLVKIPTTTKLTSFFSN